jgi:pyruvate/2-oxoglutarate dehydrogenase complex dihydrolipoamide acyltransferase (E2) component
VSDGYEILPFPRVRGIVVDGGILNRRKHLMRGLVEWDVTDVRRRMREIEEATGEAPSMTGYLVACLGRAVAEEPMVQAHRDWRGRLVVHDGVDVLMMLEVPVAGTLMPVARVLRDAHTRSVVEITREIREMQRTPLDPATARLFRWGLYLPGWLRRGMLRYVNRSVRWARRVRGTVVITSVGMFFDGPGWGIGAMSSHPLGLTVGGIGEKPKVVDGEIRVREVVDVTIDFDHDIVDGAPAARFARRLAALVESGKLLAG